MAQHLDQAFCRALAPRTNGQIVYDDTVRGFGIRVSPAGTKSFILNYWVNGRERRYTIGRFGDWSVETARKEARRLRREIDTGSDPIADREDEQAASLHERIARKFASFAEQGIEPQCYLYRHYGPDGDLLYVGQTMSAWTRSAQHLTKANWREFICLIVIEPFATREEALAAEQEAIRNEYPKYNTHHNRSRHPLREMRRLQMRGPQK